VAHPEDLHRLLQAERTAEERLHAARAATDAALKDVRKEEGISYGRLAALTGLSAETLRSRVVQPHAAAKKARQAELSRLMEVTPSLSAAEAARQLGTSRTQLTVMLGDGRLHEVEVEGRARKRIAMDAAWDAAVQAYEAKRHRTT